MCEIFTVMGLVTQLNGSGNAYGGGGYFPNNTQRIQVGYMPRQGNPSVRPVKIPIVTPPTDKFKNHAKMKISGFLQHILNQLLSTKQPQKKRLLTHTIDKILGPIGNDALKKEIFAKAERQVLPKQEIEIIADAIVSSPAADSKFFNEIIPMDINETFSMDIDQVSGESESSPSSVRAEPLQPESPESQISSMTPEEQEQFIQDLKKQHPQSPIPIPPPQPPRGMQPAIASGAIPRGIVPGVAPQSFLQGVKFGVPLKPPPSKSPKTKSIVDELKEGVKLKPTKKSLPREAKNDFAEKLDAIRKANYGSSDEISPTSSNESDWNPTPRTSRGRR